LQLSELQIHQHDVRPALFICENGDFPSWSWFDNKFFSILDQAFGGQFPHAGSATFYAPLGPSEDIIQALRRWTS